jgi:hypothetical protein
MAINNNILNNIDAEVTTTPDCGKNKDNYSFRKER